MNWKPGDKAVFVRVHGGRGPGPTIPYGSVVTLRVHMGERSRKLGHTFNMKSAWAVRSESGVERIVNEKCLRPLYDGNEKVSWEDCLWKPDEIRQVV